MDTRNFLKNGKQVLEVSFSEDELCFIEMSEASLAESLKKKVKEHNEKVGDDKRKRVTLSKLEAVYKRGVGAYRTNPQSVRPSVKSSQQWAMARVNSFLHALRNLKYKSGKHDTDLLPKSHPMSGPSGKDGRPKKASKEAPEGYHYMPDGKLMKDSDHNDAAKCKAGMEDYIFSTPEGARKKSIQIGFKGKIHTDEMADGTLMYFPGPSEDVFQKWFNENDSHDASYNKPKSIMSSDCDDDLDIDGKEVDSFTFAAELKKGVKLNKPFRTPKGPKKFSVYVKNEKGNVVKVNFGDPNMEIKRDDPDRRKSFRARHKCDTNPGPKYKARYWSCRMWESGESVKDIIS